MKLVFALGNPGSEYTGTRHNTGFIVADSLAYSRGATFVEKPKFHAYIAEFSIDNDRIIIAKPITFYNQVGKSARALIDFYKLSTADDVLVIHDDLALPFGTIRVRQMGSDAGNNGVKSLNIHTGPDYTRLRIGIAIHERTSNDASFVLSRFNGEEATSLKEEIVPKTRELIDDFLANKLEDASYNIKP